MLGRRPRQNKLIVGKQLIVYSYYTSSMSRGLGLGVAPLLAAAALMVGGCADPEPAYPDPPSSPREVAGSNADVPMLFMGNSHASYNNLQGMVEAMVRPSRPHETVEAVEAPGWMFLEDRVEDPASMALLGIQDWSYVVLQAQKYSTTGCCTYSTEEAKSLIRAARGQNAVPILFPEWPRLGVDETFTIYDLHVSIASAEPACVAPIGQAWDLSLQRHPDLRLHAGDGNHSNEAGAFLAALVLAATITGASPLDVPVQAGFGVAAEAQALLRVVAADTVAAWPPRQHCPDDPY
jgi:hypothetical protein